MKKQLLGFQLSEVSLNRYVEDVIMRRLTIRYFNVIDPAQELLLAAQYSGNSLTNAQKKVKRINQLGIKSWLEVSHFKGSIDLDFQGGLTDPRFYAVRADGVDLKDGSIALLNKINRAVGNFNFSGGNDADLLKRTIVALKKIKAVEIVRDKEGDFFHVLPEPSQGIKDLFKEVAQEESQVVSN